MEVRVEYEYTAEQADELSIKKGDIITNVVQKLDGWWEGTLGGKRGLFPDNFVKVVKDGNNMDDEVFDEPVQLRKKPSARRLKALFSYSPEQDDELALQVGDVIEFVCEVEDGWWRGKVNGKSGIFPSNFVADVEGSITNGTSPASTPENIDRKTYIKPTEKSRAIPDVIPTEAATEDEPAPKLPPKPVRELARCFYPYSAQNEDELELEEGDIVTIISKNCEDEGWWRGELRGKTGLFPDNFVKIITPNETSSSTATSNSSSTSLPLQQKISQQDSPVVPPKKELPPVPVMDSTDGAVGSKKSTPEKDALVIKKLPPAKGERGSIPPQQQQQKPMTPPSPVSPPSGGFSYLNALGMKMGLKKDKQQKEKEEAPVMDLSSGEVGEFNAVERNGQQLNHLTANRAKPPNRRPPSTSMRDSDSSLQNGGGGHDSLESPTHHNHSTISNGGLSPVGHSFNSSRMDSTASTAVVSDSSGLSSTPGSRFSYSRDEPNNSTGYSGTPTSINPQSAKPKQLPWMLELKQTQDKKRQSTSPVAPSSNTSTTTSSSAPPASSSPSLSSSSSSSQHTIAASASPTPALNSIPVLRSREPPNPSPSSKAPPLPAKPVLNPVVPAAAAAATASPVTASPGTTTTSTLSARLGRKTPTNGSGVGSNVASNYVNTILSPSATTTTNNATNNNVNNNTSTTATTNANNSYVNANTDGKGSNPAYVSYEDHARLKDRVFFLESELEAVKKQLKLLLDRDMSRGHIV